VRGVPVLLSGLWAAYPTSRLILHEKPHKLILSGSNCSKLTGGHNGGRGGALARGACSRPRPVDGYEMSSSCSSTALVRTICHN
jgi:hypothetical protein